mmetsp:Transcript_3086/g.7282  ORF Transcript_3086/g.7282 Transcript_3086/m.7282 type:complete len:208 (-) Transcript_3086:425-1048(-)
MTVLQKNERNYCVNNIIILHKSKACKCAHARMFLCRQTLVSVLGAVGFVATTCFIFVVVVPNRDTRNATYPHVIFISQLLHEPSRVEFQTSRCNFNGKEASVRKDLGNLQCIDVLPCRNSQFHVNQHFLASSRDVINDTGNRVELNSISDGPNRRLGGTTVPVLVDPKSQLDEKQIRRKSRRIHQIGAQPQALPFLAPARSLFASKL